MAITFPSFHLLPLELRRKIWYHALQHFPRIFEIRTHTKPSTHFIQDNEDESPTIAISPWHVTVDQPSVLSQVSKEFRDEYMLHSHALHPFTNQNLRFSPIVDTLFINTQSANHGLHGKTLNEFFSEVFGEKASIVKKELRFLAGNDICWCRWLMANSMESLVDFEKLEMVMYVMWWGLRDRSVADGSRVVGLVDADLGGRDQRGFRNVKLIVEKACEERGFGFEHRFCDARVESL